MKHIYPSILMVALLASCSVNEDKSDAYGNFEATEIIISSEVGGKILQFEQNQGHILSKDEVIIIIDSTDLVLKKGQLLASKNSVLSGLSNIEAQIKVYEQQLNNLAKDEKRIQNLLKENAATQKQMDDISGMILLVKSQAYAVKTQRQGIMSKALVFDEQLKQVDQNINKCIILSPINASLLTKYAEVNELAMPGKPLLKIANLNKMELRVYVSGEQLAGIKTGQEVMVLVDKNKKENRELKGIVSWVSQEAEFTPKIIQTKKERVNMVYAVKVTVENNGFLRIGMPGEVRF